MAKLSQLNQEQLQHLAWRLDRKTSCGLLTAIRVAKLGYGDLSVVEVFERFGGRPSRSAKIHATKVSNFILAEQI